MKRFPKNIIGPEAETTKEGVRKRRTLAAATGDDIEHDVKKYLSLPYSRELLPNLDGTWFGRVREFPGCTVDNEGLASVGMELEKEMAAWVRDMLQRSIPIPAPNLHVDYSGKFFARLPKTLHRELAGRALREGVSLNQFVAVALSRAVAAGYRVIVRIGTDASGHVASRVGQVARTVAVDGSTARVVISPSDVWSTPEAHEAFFVDPSSAMVGYESHPMSLERFARSPDDRLGDGLKYVKRGESVEAEEYSGRFVIRLPRSLHRELAEQSEREDMSLNQFVQTTLAKAVASGHQTIVRINTRAVVIDGGTGRVLVGQSHDVLRDDFTTEWSAASGDTVVLDPASATVGYGRRLVDLQVVAASDKQRLPALR